MKLTLDRADIVVPGSIVGFGTGYSTLAVATLPADHVDVKAIAGPTQVTGLGLGERVLDPSKHGTVVAIRTLLDRVGSPQVGVDLVYRASIPRGSGLGAHDAQIVAGVVAAFRLLGSPEELDAKFLLDLAVEVGASRHRAYVSLMGGGVLAPREGIVVPVLLSPRTGLQITAFVPGFSLDESSETVFKPRTVRYLEAEHSATSMALQLGLLTGSIRPTPQVLLEATNNALKGEDSSQRSPASVALVDWFREQGLAAFVAGSGPAVVVYGFVSEPVSSAASRSGWRAIPLVAATEGAL